MSKPDCLPLGNELGRPLHDLAEKVEWAWHHSRELAEMGKQARREYELRYTPEVNYSQLMNIYRQTVATYA